MNDKAKRYFEAMRPLTLPNVTAETLAYFDQFLATVEVGISYETAFAEFLNDFAEFDGMRALLKEDENEKTNVLPFAKRYDDDLPF